MRRSRVNLFNQAQFKNQTNLNPLNPDSFGRITDTYAPRQIQFGAKIVWGQGSGPVSVFYRHLTPNSPRITFSEPVWLLNHRPDWED